MGVAGEGVQDKDRVVATFVEGAPGLVGHGDSGKDVPGFEGEVADLHESALTGVVVAAPCS